MIDTFYNLDALGTPQAFLLALLIGIGFGFALDRAGFSSSRRLAGVFYFTDMAVVKVMFTAMLTVDNIVAGATHDIWEVNVEEEYHEQRSGTGTGGTGRDAPVLPSSQR